MIFICIDLTPPSLSISLSITDEVSSRHRAVLVVVEVVVVLLLRGPLLLLNSPYFRPDSLTARERTLSVEIIPFSHRFAYHWNLLPRNHPCSLPLLIIYPFASSSASIKYHVAALFDFTRSTFLQVSIYHMAHYSSLHFFSYLYKLKVKSEKRCIFVTNLRCYSKLYYSNA